MPIQLLSALLAGLPILIVVTSMIALHWSAARAGAAGLAVALLLAWGPFRFGRGVPMGLSVVDATGGAIVEAVFTALTILWIIFPALCIYQLQVRTEAMEVLRRSLARLTADPRLVAILVAWFFALFLEGAAGFGTTVALAAPFLVSVGFRPIDAVTMALIGHAVGVSFGAVGTPILPQIAATGFSGLQLAQANGLFHTALGWIMPLAMMSVAVRTTPGPWHSPATWSWTLLASALFLVPFWAISQWVGPELPTLGGALIGGAAFAGLLRVFSPAIIHPAHDAGPKYRTGDLIRAAAPYLVLVALILLTRLVTPLRLYLSHLEWEWTLLEVFRGSVAPLYHPGTLLFLGFLLGGLWQRASLADLRGAMAAAAGQLKWVTVALVLMLSLSRVMVHAGMIESLAVAAAAGFAGVWPLLSPFVGVLGTFVTGSATASNILFTDFQEATAQHLGLPVLTMTGVQGFGAAVGNIICPHNIIAGGATVGITGQEGEVLRRTLLPCLVYAACGGMLAFAITGA